MRKIRIFDTRQALGLTVAGDIAERIAAKNGQFLLGCPGGRSPKPVYAALALTARDRAMDLSRLVIVMMDDYVAETPAGFVHVDPEAHYSCRRFARREIQAVLNSGLPTGRQVADPNVWFPDPARPFEFDHRIATAGGIDFFLLASGASDGHVAFNPAGSPIDGLTRIVELSEATRRDNLRTFPDFAGIDAVPRFGVTVGIGTISQARETGMLVWGEDKRRAFRHLAAATGYDPAWPATVWTACRNATLYADRDAAEGTLT